MIQDFDGFLQKAQNAKPSSQKVFIDALIKNYPILESEELDFDDYIAQVYLDWRKGDRGIEHGNL